MNRLPPHEALDRLLGSSERRTIERRSMLPPRILLVDDRALNRLLLRQILEVAFEVVEAGSAGEALELAQIVEPALIVTDLEMPGMHGLELLERIRASATLRTVPVVILTANSRATVQRRSFSLGCTEFLAKPILMAPEELIERLLRLVKGETQAVPPGKCDARTCEAEILE